MVKGDGCVPPSMVDPIERHAAVPFKHIMYAIHQAFNGRLNRILSRVEKNSGGWYQFRFLDECCQHERQCHLRHPVNTQGANFSTTPWMTQIHHIHPIAAMCISLLPRGLTHGGLGHAVVGTDLTLAMTYEINFSDLML